MTKETMQVTIEETLKRRFKAACVMDGFNMSEVVSQLLEGWLNERENSKTEGVQDGTRQKPRQRKARSSKDS